MSVAFGLGEAVTPARGLGRRRPHAAVPAESRLFSRGAIGLRIVCGVVGCVVVLWLATATGAAASAWAVERTPIPPGVNSELDGVSCAAPRSCTAVGFMTGAAGAEATLAERWNGGSWSIQPTPKRAGATDGSLVGVSCSSSRSCIAVGSSITRGGAERTLAERWNGANWSIQRTRDPAGATSSRLVGVSCASSRSCIAVGFWYYERLPSSEVMLAERWNGTSWSVQRTPNPAGATFGQFGGVSCVPAGTCTAVGFLSNGADVEVTLAERWYGSGWSIQTTPTPAGARSSGLDGVSCVSPRSCTAVGFLTNPAGTVGQVAERWNGTGWILQRTPNRIGGGLVGVSCASTITCAAVGSSGGATLAEGSNATGWAVQRTPNLAYATKSQLDGVSCAARGVCTAVGFFTDLAGINMTLAEQFS